MKTTTSMKSVISIALLILLFSCQHKKDYVFNDDDIRFIINERNNNRTWEFPSFTIDKGEYNRLLISKNLLGKNEKTTINVFKIDQEKGYREILASTDRLSYQGNIGLIPYEEGNYFVYEIHKFPVKNMLILFDVPAGENPLISWDCGLDIKIINSKAFHKKS